MAANRYTPESLTAAPIDRSVTRLLYINTARYSAEWNPVLHTHPCAEIFFITDGAGHLRTKEQTVPIETNDVIIVNPNIEHTEISSKTRPLEYIVMGVNGLEAISGNADSNKAGNGHFVIPSRPEGEQILFYLRCLLTEIENKQPGYDTVCQDLLEIALLLLMRHSQFAVTFIPAARKRGKECAIARSYIENHFKENLTLDDLAAAAHVSKYYLAHSFSREYGTSPINYLLSCRIQESLYLLSETSHSLSQISSMLGFSSPSYFSQSFRRIQGMSPMEYRKRHKDEGR